MPSRKLTMAEISDLRAYERERESFRHSIIELKKRRWVQVGPVVTLLFENRETIRFQVQEMARAERMLDDAQIQAELDIYNPLLPEPGQLSATLFVELTSQQEMGEWLPKLVGIESMIAFELDGRENILCQPEAAHAAQLTKEEVTASVHYVQFHLTPSQVERFGSAEVVLAAVHPNYQHKTVLAPQAKKELLQDLEADT